MNELEIFKNEDFGEVRVSFVDDEPWFCLSDICKILEISNHKDVRNRLSEKGVGIIDTLTKGGKQGLLYVNESNLYKIIFQSKKPNAEKFTDWITEEVIPSIRKTGTYSIKNDLSIAEQIMNDPKLVANIILMYGKEKEKNKLLEDKIKKDEPKVLLAESITESSTSIPVSNLAKILKQNGYDTGQKRLFKQLRDEGYIMYDSLGYNVPTQKSMDMGLFEIRQTTKKDSSGIIHTNIVSRVTGKGQLYFINKYLGKSAIKLLTLKIDEEIETED